MTVEIIWDVALMKMFQKVRYKHRLSWLLILVLVETTLGRQFGGYGWFRKHVLDDPTPDGAPHVVAACQEDKMVLQCKNEFNKMHIESAFYGRDNKHTCKSRVIDSDTLCQASDMTKIEKKVRDLCHGETRCQIPVTKTFFAGTDGNPFCPGIRKYLRVKYTCSQVPHFDMTCPGSCNNKCWPACESNCCSPPPPTPPPTVKPLVLESLPALVQQETLAPGYYVPGSTCPTACDNRCAPLCNQNCCHSFKEPLPVSMNQEVVIRPTQSMYGAADTAIIELPTNNVVPLPARRISRPARIGARLHVGAPVRLPPRPMVGPAYQPLVEPAHVLTAPQPAQYHVQPAHRYNPRPHAIVQYEASPQSCPYSCVLACRSYCAPRCCTAAAKAAQAAFTPRFQRPNTYNPYRPQPSDVSLELARRRSYQTILARYRAKQMAEYYGRQRNGKK